MSLHGGAQFRSSDVSGREIDVSRETPTARAERISALQDRWQPKELPATNPADVLAEWMAASSGNRLSRFAQVIAEHPEYVPACELEPRPGQAPQPGGLIEKLTRQASEHYAAASRNTGQIR